MLYVRSVSPSFSSYENSFYKKIFKHSNLNLYKMKIWNENLFYVYKRIFVIFLSAIAIFQVVQIIFRASKFLIIK